MYVFILAAVAALGSLVESSQLWLSCYSQHIYLFSPLALGALGSLGESS